MLKVSCVFRQQPLFKNFCYSFRHHPPPRVWKHPHRPSPRVNNRVRAKLKMEHTETGASQARQKQQKQHQKWKKRDQSKLRHITNMEKVSAGGGQLPVPGTVNITTIGTGAAGTPQGIFVDMNLFRYLFNCGEGTQRAALELKLKLSRVQDIFITHSSWKNVGGLLGMILSMDDVSVPELRLHGPPGFERFLTTSRTFAPLRGIKITKLEVSDQVCKDGGGIIEYIPILPSSSSTKSSSTMETSCIDSASDEVPQASACPEASSSSSPSELKSPCQPGDSDMEPAAKKPRYSEAPPPDSDMSVVYVCKPHPKPGRLSLEKCVDLGVTKGPQFGLLKKGETITLEDGRQVRPEDVLDIPDTPEMFIVLECPSVDYLSSLTSNPRLIELQSSTDCSLKVIIHFTPDEIINTTEYTNWMNAFGENVKHLVMNGSGSEICHTELYNLQAKLNLLSDTVFPLLPHQRQDALLDDCRLDEESPLVKARSGLNYALRVGKSGRIGFSSEQCIVLDNESSVKEAMEVEGFSETMRQVKTDLQKLEAADGVQSGHYPKLVFFGTGSAIPNTFRNVTGILVHFDDNMCAMFDCGEGSAGQLYRNYGDEAASVLRKMSAIFISHLHADHHLGLFALLEERLKAFKSVSMEAPKLHLIAPFKMTSWLNLIHHQVFPVHDMINFIPIEIWTDAEAKDPQLSEGARSLYQSLVDESKRAAVMKKWRQCGALQAVLDSLRLQKIMTVRMLHRQHPHGIVLKHNDGWQVAFSGDTMKCPDFIRIGKDSDILIHEATMEDGMEEDAKEKMHSTTTDALTSGQEMNAKYTLLTHFSQRYTKVPFLADNLQKNFGIAFDNMHVRLCDMPKLPLFIPALKALFSSDIEAMEIRSMRKNKKKEKEKEGK